MSSADGIGDEMELFRISGIRFLDVFKAEEMRINSANITVFQGPSGSGKTTMLRFLNRMAVPDEGSIKYEGRSIEDVEPVELRRRVVMLMQTPVLFTESVRDEVCAGCEFSGHPLPEDEEICTLLERLNLKKSLDENPSTFSGGELQRLSLARVLLMDPPVLLLDEPSAALDKETEERVFEIVAEYRDRGKTVIMASHSSAIEALAPVNIYHIVGGEFQNTVQRREE
jgi:putative ABC transport system ATP-binding protein